MTDGAPGEARRRPSIYDVARRAGVSHMTVSRVVNNAPNIRHSTRIRVLAAIDELGYSPSDAARALATRRAMTIGVLVDKPTQNGPRSTVLALEKAARLAGYRLRAYSLSWPPVVGEIADAVTEFQTAAVDAVCAVVRRYDALEELRAHTSSLPTIVAADLSGAEHGARYTAIDQTGGTALAVEHLAGLGHREMVYIAGSSDTIDGRKRLESWTNATRIHGLPGDRIFQGDWTSECGHHVASRADLTQVTAIVAGNDQMALGVLHGLHRRGVRVPQDVSVVGYDDQIESAHFIPSLTTVRQDFSELGRALLASLLNEIEGGAGPRSTLLSTELVVRESTALRRTPA